MNGIIQKLKQRQGKCRRRDLNSYDRFQSRDFKSLVSTNSTTPAKMIYYTEISQGGQDCLPIRIVIYVIFPKKQRIFRLSYKRCRRNPILLSWISEPMREILSRGDRPLHRHGINTVRFPVLFIFPQVYGRAGLR